MFVEGDEIGQAVDNGAWKVAKGCPWPGIEYRGYVYPCESQRSCQQRVFIIPKAAFSKARKTFTDNVYALDLVKHFNHVDRMLVEIHFKILKRRISCDIAITNIYLISYNYRKQNRYSLFRVVRSFVKRHLVTYVSFSHNVVALHTIDKIVFDEWYFGNYSDVHKRQRYSWFLDG